MTEMPAHYDDVGAYFHNPFGFPTKQQQEARKYFEDMQNIIPDYRMSKALKALFKNPNHFGDLDSLHRLGLQHHYKTLKNYVIDNNLIGLIIYGSNINQEEYLPPNETDINVYTTQNGTKISLNIQEISRRLLIEYCDYYGDEVNELCKKALNNLLPVLSLTFPR